MRNILIDTNIYLDFYKSNMINYQKISEYLKEIESKIFISSQIINEIERNKCKVFNDTFNEYLKNLKTSNFMLPKQFCEIEKVEQWNKKYTSTCSTIKELKSELEIIQNEITKDIVQATDKVSIVLSEILKNPIEETKEEYSSAHYRKSLGNPPGKKTDPIGDELTWEQFINHIKEGYSKTEKNKIYIITKDGDYFVKSGKELYLNPQLYRELNLICKDGFELYCYENLSDFIKAYSEQTNDIKSIDSAVLDRAREEEINENLNRTSRATFYYLSLDERNPKSKVCPYCNAVGTLSDPKMRRSMYGGMTLQFYCTNCENYIDTGDDQDY